MGSAGVVKRYVAVCLLFLVFSCVHLALVFPGIRQRLQGVRHRPPWSDTRAGGTLLEFGKSILHDRARKALYLDLSGLTRSTSIGVAYGRTFVEIGVGSSDSSDSRSRPRSRSYLQPGARDLHIKRVRLTQPGT